jgi:CubicO group peptidase (beta-lactamase class C family)
VDLIAALEEATGRLMPQVMESKVCDPQYLTRARERRADASGIVGEDEFGVRGLPFDDRPSFRRVFESAVIAFLVGGMFRVAHDAAA